MENKRYKPLVDKLFFIIFIPTAFLMVGLTIFACFEPIVLLIMLPSDLLTFYFLLSPLFGYVELRESSLFIKYGLILKREIPYDKVRGAEKVRKFYSESMMSLKNSFEHVNIKYNSFDVTSVSVVENDNFIEELIERCFKK
jgi:hypothetical protein